MIRIFYKFINPIRKLYWFLFRPKTRGVKCLIRYQAEILMIRNSYGKMYWTFPGGGVNRGEHNEDAAKREVFEEVGIKVTNINFLGEYQSTRQYKRDTVYCYSAEVLSLDYKIDPGEVLEVKWFPVNSLPQPQSPAVQQVMSLYNNR